ncbi:MAG TPA: T9SS type A sorting domain-containing protein, partial [Flavobacteriales bacterium]|nr:T9SS type A sorting domain-containing protein [Flavobacteriales bacterium]
GALDAPTFPAFAQPWEYKRETGGAFFILFDLNYFLEWSSAYGSWHYYNGIPVTRITDMKWDRNSWNTSGIKSIWFCGSDWLGTPEIPTSAPPDATAPDLFTNPTGGYYHDEGNVLIGRLNPTSHVIDYATLWPGRVAYGLNVTQTSVWVVGYAWDTQQFTEEHMPEPQFGGGYVHHETTGQGMSEGFFLRFRRTPFDLAYGSLIGGQRDDVLLDVSTRSQGEVFITGETRSSYGFSTDLNTDRYFQEQHDFSNRRDAFILSIKDSDNPVMNWRTAFGGVRSDRGWGVAASASELYLCGATTSDNEDGFPLVEAIPDNPSNPASYLDFMQYWNQGGASSWFVPGYGYSHILSNLSFWEAPVESPKIGHDGFIASFWLVEAPGVGLNEPAQMNLNVALLTDDGHYLVRMPAAIAWQLELYDALGKRLDTQRMNDERCFIDLSAHASGTYLLRATAANGQVFTAKLIRP